MKGRYCMKQIEIKLTKCLLVLDEQELIRALPPPLLQKGILKGKAYKRATEFKKRMEAMSND
jgi:hypothetical protein